MTRGRTERILVRRGRDGTRGDAPPLGPDDVIVEEPLEIRLDGHLVTTTMRTPGHDFELAAGFCHSEGLLGGALVRDVRYCATGSAVTTEFNVVTVGTAGHAPAPAARLGLTTSSCGICGAATLEHLCERLLPLPHVATVDASVLRRVASAARDHQPLFAATGAVHAAIAFDARTGDIVHVREDVGRHNAVDKVVGRLLLDRDLPAAGLGLFLSGRIGFELVQKAWAAGFGLVAAVGAPSALAVRTAVRARIAMVGFVRDGSFNVYVPVDGR